MLSPETPGYHAGLRRQVYFDAMHLALDGPRGLTDRLGTLSEHMKAGQMLMVRLAENQMELKPILTRLAATAENASGQDDVVRTHLRNIEAYMARMSEDLVEGRSQSVADLRGEIRLLARTIAAHTDESSGR